MVISEEEKRRRDQYKAVYRNGGRPKVKCKQCMTKFDFNPRGRWRDFCTPSCRVAYNRAAAKIQLDNSNDTC